MDLVDGTGFWEAGAGGGAPPAGATAKITILPLYGTWPESPKFIVVFAPVRA